MTAMITREMVVEKLSAMFKAPSSYKILKEGSVELTKYSVGRIDVYRRVSILSTAPDTNYFCRILDLHTGLPLSACEEIFKYVELMYDKRKDGYREEEVERILQYVTI